MKKYLFLLPLLAVMACSTPQNVVYVQDMQTEKMLAVQDPQQMKVQPGDKLYIRVHSRDQALEQMFNLNGGTGGSSSGGSSQGGNAYTVDAKGQIDMPVLGLINVKGLTRMEIANVIKYRLVSSKLIKDPVVTVEFANLGFSALGELNSPGWHQIDRDQLTLLEAIALCGDLTLNGQRENVLVIRTIDGKQIPYRVDLTSTQSIYSSPVYYVQQNDVIYVEPNETKINNSTAMGNSWRTPTFWMGLFSFAIGLVFMFTK